MGCPDEAELIAYASGQLSDAKAAGVAEHLPKCRACRQRVQEEVANESVLVKLRETVSEEQPPARPGAVATRPMTSPEDLQVILGDRYKIDTKL